MSAQFVVIYKGAPVKFEGTQIELVSPDHASVFANEAEAWWSAYQSQLTPTLLAVELRERVGHIQVEFKNN